MDELQIHFAEFQRLGDRVQDTLTSVERSFGLALTVLGGAFAIGGQTDAAGLSDSQRWFLVLLPAIILGLAMLGMNRMAEVFALGGERKWHEERVNELLRSETLVSETKLRDIRRNDPAGAVAYSVIPALALVGASIAGATVAWNVQPALGVTCSICYVLFGLAAGISFVVGSEAGTRSYDAASGNPVHFWRIPFSAQTPETRPSPSPEAVSSEEDEARSQSRRDTEA